MANASLLVLCLVFLIQVSGRRVFDAFCGSELFFNVELQDIELSFCTVEDCFVNADGCYRRNSYHIEIGNTELIPVHSFVNATKLRQIKAVHKNIRILASGSFVNLPALESIDLSFNLIRGVKHLDEIINQKRILQSLEQQGFETKNELLVKLNDHYEIYDYVCPTDTLAKNSRPHNLCGPLSVDDISRGRKLVYYFVESLHKKTYVHNDVFINVAAKKMDLSWNRIRFVEENVFVGLRNLEILDLSHNEIPVFFGLPRISALRELILSYNFIEKLAVSSKTYPNLTLLDLSFNSLELFAITSEIPMKKIDLTRNLLDDISVFKVSEVKELRLSLNEFTFMISRDIEQIFQKVRKISLYPNPWSCEVLSDIWKRLYQHNITLSNPEDDYRLAKQHERFPICLEVTPGTRYNDESREIIENFRERGVKFLKDKHSSCNESSMCSDTEICRNRQCFNPCKEDVCDFTSLCRAEKHSFSCDCPRNQKRDPKDLYSRCYTVECFQDFDCPDYSNCDTKSHLCEFSEISKKHNSKFHIDAVGNAVTKHNIQYNSLSPPVVRQHPWYYDKEDPALRDF